MKVICPHCKNSFDLRLTGRKPADIDFTTICNALLSTKRSDGTPAYSAAARFIEETTGESYSPGLFQVRVQREADRRGIGRETLLAGILSGQVTGRQKPQG